MSTPGFIREDLLDAIDTNVSRVNSLNRSNEQSRRYFEEFSQRIGLSLAD